MDSAAITMAVDAGRSIHRRPRLVKHLRHPLSLGYVGAGERRASAPVESANTMETERHNHGNKGQPLKIAVM